MLINGAAIMGAAVVTQQDKKQVAEVSDLVMNPKTQKIDAFLIGGSKPSDGKAVLMKDVQKVTKDEIIITSENAIKQAANVLKPTKSDKKFMAQTKVVTDQGKEVGELKDVFFDTSSGAVKQLSIVDKDDNTQAELLIQIEDIKSMGDEIIIKSSATESTPNSKGILKKTEEFIHNIS